VLEGCFNEGGDKLERESWLRLPADGYLRATAGRDGLLANFLGIRAKAVSNRWGLAISALQIEVLGEGEEPEASGDELGDGRN